MKYNLFFLFTFSFLTAICQNGNIRGTVFDNSNGQTLPGVKVIVDGIRKGAFTDLDGKFDISIGEGTYTIILSMQTFDTVFIKDISVKSGNPTILDDIMLGSQISDLGTVKITTETKKNTENALLSLKMRSSNLIDGITASSFRKIGDSDAASAMKRVSGVSVAGGKYVFVRGLGDRYNKTMLNGLDIPGLDPDRNTIQMDIFPTNIIDNMIINKSFVAELPADFTGGLINIDLKSFPSERKRTIALNTGYNPNFHFNNNYLTYKGGKTDFLGFDDGTREIPAINNIPFFVQAVGNPNGENGQRYREILESFNPNLAAMKQTSLMDFGLGFSLGNQFKKEKYTLAYNFLLSYKNTSEFYEDAIFGRYGLPGDKSQVEMQTREYQIGNYGVNNVLISTLGGFSIKTQNSKYSIKLLHLQNGESKAGIFDFINADQGAEFYGFQHNLEYSQKSLSNLFIGGKHFLSEKKWHFDWKVSPTYSSIIDPDIRFTRYEDKEGTWSISTESGFPERIWRELSEINIVTAGNAKKELEIFKNKANIKFGYLYSYKQRDFNVRSFQLNVRNIPLTGDPNELFADENIWPYNGDASSGTTFETSFNPNNPNKFNSNIQNIGGYTSSEFNATKWLKTIVGVRFEQYAHRYTGQNQLGTNILTNDIVLKDLGIFPSLNMVASINKKQNIRFSYGKTIARPSFKELSYAEIFDPITGRTFIGSLFRDADDGAGIVYWDGNLVSTDIHNLDFRWELFPSFGNTISFSTFYKKFINPIEIIQFATQSGSFQPRNVGDGQVFGFEFEARYKLDFISKSLENFSFIVNLTYAESQIKLSQTEYDSRVLNAREGQTISEYRDMAGQAPYIINGGLRYDGGEKGIYKGLEAGVYYNIQGETLQFAGIVDRPDIYTVPFNSLNININKTFGKKENMRLGIKASNILNDKKEMIFKSFQAESQYFSSLNIGTSVSIRFSYDF